MRIALGLKHLRQVTTTAPIPAAATLAWTSATSVRDPVFTLTGILAGDIVQLQIDDDPAFGSTYGDDTNTVDSTEAADGQLTFSGISTLAYATTYYARARITRAGQTSAWSNSASKTMDAAPNTTWDPAKKSTAISLDATKLIASGTNTVGAFQPVMGLNGKTSGKKYFELSFLNPSGDNAGFGVVNTLPPNVSVNPGADTNGVHYGLGNGWVVYGGSTLATQTIYTHATVPAIGLLAIDLDLDKVWFGLNGTFTGSPAAGTGGYSVPGVGTAFPSFAAWNVNACTLRRKASEFTYSPPAGFTGWDD
jgi:hypothetical protein